MNTQRAVNLRVAGAADVNWSQSVQKENLLQLSIENIVT